MQIIEGLHQLQIPIPNNPLGFVNVYAIQGDDGWTIVDTGFPADEAFRSLISQVSTLTGDIAAVKRIIITHWHIDHFGLVYRMKAATGAQVLMHEADAAFVNTITYDREKDVKDFAESLVQNGAPGDAVGDIASPPIYGNSDDGRRFEPDVVLRDGDKLRFGRFCFEVVATPGHTVGHICLFEPRERILISGDHVLPVITPAISYYYKTTGDPLASFLRSLQHVKGLDVARVLPAHEHLFDNLPHRVEEIREHHLRRCDAIEEVIGVEAKTAWEVSTVIPWAEGQMIWSEMSQFHRLMAVSETLAHLHFMANEMKVERVADGELYRWRRRMCCNQRLTGLE